MESQSTQKPMADNNGSSDVLLQCAAADANSSQTATLSSSHDQTSTSTSSSTETQPQMMTQPSPKTLYPHQIHGKGGPTATAPFLQDFCLVAEAAKRAELAVVMRDMESISL